MLKALELVGFKSFADKTRFDFPRGITAVVGPNGSGKSNVVDAIKWVLGEQSVKSLRGKEMADVIFNGSASRAPVNFAETTLTLDNSQRRLPIDATEVHVTRRVYRNGEGEYLLNRQPCRLRDIRELFSGTGVATEAYSVIEQGKVDVLLQSSPRDRRLIFEEAAGISRFKAKKVESLRRLERVEQNLLRLGDIVAEVEHRLRQVRQQAAKARRYQEHSARLEELRTHVALSDWRQLCARLTALDEEFAALTGERDRANADAESCDTLAAELETQLSTIAENLRAVEAQAALVRENIATRETTVENQLRRSAELDTEAARLRRQLSAVTVRVGGLQQQLEDASAQLRVAEAEHSRAAASALEREQELAQLNQQRDAARRQADAARQEYLAEMRRAAQWESEISSWTARLESARSLATQYQQKVAELAAARAALETDSTNCAQQEQQVAAELAEQTRREQIARAQRAAVLDNQRKIEIELAETRRRHAAGVERISVLEEFQRAREGYSDAVKDILAQAQSATSGPFLHVRGVVAELLKVSVEMAPLIESALGARAQQIVVSSLDDMLAALTKSPQHFPSQVTFAAVESRSGKSPAATIDLSGQPGIVGRADTFVETSPEFVPLASRLLGRTWIVDTLQRAIELSRTHSELDFATLTGEVVTAEGGVSFGPCVPAAGLISRRSELDVLHADVQKLEAGLTEQAKSAAMLDAELTTVQHTMVEAEQQRAHLAASLRELRTKIAATQQRIAQIIDESARAGREQAQAEQLASTATANLQTTEQRLTAARATLGSIEAQAAELTARVEAIERQRSAVEAATATARVELGKCEERLANLRLRSRQLEQDHLERRRTVDDATAELRQSLARGTQASRVVLAAESELAELYLQKEGCVAQAGRLLVEQQSQRAARALLLSEGQRMRGAMRELDERLHTHQLSAHDVLHTRTTLAERMREDYEIDLAALTSAESAKDNRSRDEIDGEIAELRRKIQHIGNVNLDALSELEELEARFAHLSGQHQDLTSAKQSLVTIIDRINADSRRLFAETLEKVRLNFQTLFRKLFGGGQADIVLDEGADILESGIEIVARPPGKEPRSISLLSGGEKTLTCVALLLAIFQYRPSPFCVLDEVDAALDEANIERFIGVLQEFLAWTQFVVVTHSKKTMTCATTLYGVTMQESGVSKRVAVRFEDISADGELHPDADQATAQGSGAESQSDEIQAA